MSYERAGGEALDYKLYRLGNSRVVFRGPGHAVTGESLVFLGGSETYGKYIREPFPTQVEKACGRNCINLGVMNAGVDVFLSEPAVLQAARQSRLTILQIPGAQNMSNRYYTVHPRRNDRFTGASAVMKMVFREIDFTEFHFTRHLLGALAARAPERYVILREELQQAWIARMKLLLNTIGGDILLLWAADHAPGPLETPYGIGRDPLFVERHMIEALRPYVSGVVEAVISREAQAKGAEGMVCGDLDLPTAQRMFGPAAHEEIGAAISQWISRRL